MMLFRDDTLSQTNPLTLTSPWSVQIIVCQILLKKIMTTQSVCPAKKNHEKTFALELIFYDYVTINRKTRNNLDFIEPLGYYMYF